MTLGIEMFKRPALFRAGISEESQHGGKNNRRFAHARDRGQSILHHLANLFSKRGKGKLTNVSLTSFCELFLHYN